MSAVEDGFQLGGTIVTSVFSALDSAELYAGVSLLSFLLAIIAFILTIEFLFAVLGVDFNLWDYVFSEEGD